MKLETKFDIKDIVYLITDREQQERIITQINYSEKGVSYQLNQSAFESWHYEFEITKERDIIKVTT